MRRRSGGTGFFVALASLVLLVGTGVAHSQEDRSRFTPPTRPSRSTTTLAPPTTLALSTTVAPPTTASPPASSSVTPSESLQVTTTALPQIALAEEIARQAGLAIATTAPASPPAALQTAQVASPAAPAIAPQAAASASSPTILMVIDTSGSMAGSKLDQAKQALTASVGVLGPAQPAGLRSYAGACGNRGILRVPIGVDNRPQLRSEIASLSAGGNTPTPDALLGAASDLAGVSGARAILLVSDGQSTCGNPCPTAETIKNQQGIDFKVHTVGFQAPASAEAELDCIARVTGGSYVPVDDADALADAIGSVIGGTRYEYVAVGDSTTTGFSIPTCKVNSAISEYGCTGTPPATPYPQHVSNDGGADLDSLVRKGIWGYTVQKAVRDFNQGFNSEDGPWETQLRAAVQATNLVTVSLGANDMNFSDYKYWLGVCVGAKVKTFLGRPYPSFFVASGCEGAAKERAAQMRGSLEEMFGVLDQARDRGAEVVITLQYNPFNEFKAVRFAPDRTCKLLHTIGAHITNALNTELERAAKAHGFTIADFRPHFAGKGAGSSDSYVFGSDCETVGAASAVDFDLGWPPVNVGETTTDIQKKFDPHPNAKGTRAQANAILEAI